MSGSPLVRAADVDPKLRSWLAKKGGSATFEEFFEAALYHPDLGYYSTNIRTVGQGGDFSTSATLDPGLSRAIANWITATRKSASPTIRDIIEIGAGDGSLAEAILTEFQWLERRQIRYHIVDTSGPLRDSQRENLGRRKNVHWHKTVEDALRECDGRSLIFSNELIDAFPPRVFQWNAEISSWEELSIHFDDEGNLAEFLSQVGSPPSVSIPLSFADGQRIERHESHEGWLAEWTPSWKAGEMLTIDYGDEYPAVYHRRPRGTIRGYCHHLHFESGPDVYARFGRQDLTTDIDFTDLITSSERCKLRARPLQSQGDFIRDFLGDKGKAPPHLGEVRTAFKVARFAPCTHPEDWRSSRKDFTSPPA